jgi:hypothetical protein
MKDLFDGAPTPSPKSSADRERERLKAEERRIRRHLDAIRKQLQEAEDEERPYREAHMLAKAALRDIWRQTYDRDGVPLPIPRSIMSRAAILAVYDRHMLAGHGRFPFKRALQEIEAWLANAERELHGILAELAKLPD